jgi:hypothetical protein
MDEMTEEQVEQLKLETNAAGVRLAEAFVAWKAKSESEKPVMQEVSDAWDLLMFRTEQYVETSEPLRQVGQSPCGDCPDHG